MTRHWILPLVLWTAQALVTCAWGSTTIVLQQRILSAALTMYYNDAGVMTGSDDAITIRPFRVNGGKSWYENRGDFLNGQGVNFLYRDQSMQ